MSTPNYRELYEAEYQRAERHAKQIHGLDDQLEQSQLSIDRLTKKCDSLDCQVAACQQFHVNITQLMADNKQLAGANERLKTRLKELLEAAEDVAYEFGDSVDTGTLMFELRAAIEKAKVST